MFLRYLTLSLLLVAQTGPAIADDIRLVSPDSQLDMTGALIGFEDGVYTLQTAVGEIRISSDLVTCEGEACPVAQEATPDFTIKGSDTIGVELMPLLVRGYAESIGGVVNNRLVAERQALLTILGDQGRGEPLFSTLIEDLGSSTGFVGLLDRSAVLGMSSRAVRSSEVEELAAAGLGDLSSFEQEHGIAVDGLLIVVHPDNPVAALTEEQISAILAGEVTNWSEVGGPDLPVTVYSRDTNSGTYGTIEDRFLTPYARTLGRETRILAGNVEISDSVYNDLGGLGYVGFAFRADTKPVAILSSCGIAAEASEFAARTGEYPLQRTLYLYTTNVPLPAQAAALLDYAKSPEADGVIEKSGFIGFSVDTRDQSGTAQVTRAAIDTNTSRQEVALLRELYIDLLEWRRASPTFRFRTGSATLDNASRRDLLRLTRFLTDNPDITEIAVVGFTDSDGAFEANQALGLDRAEAIRTSIAAEVPTFDADNILVKSFGELNPVACNDNFAGQQLNRRVEVWFR